MTDFSLQNYIDLSFKFKRFIIIDNRNDVKIKPRKTSLVIIVKTDLFYYFDLTYFNVYCSNNLVRLETLNQSNILANLTNENEMFNYYKGLLI